MHTPPMVPYPEFRRTAPEIAPLIHARLVDAGLGYLGTIRLDGSPRVSPVEVIVRNDGLFIGMMPQSRKALDLLRDPRCMLVTALADRDDIDGEGKLACHAHELHESDAGRVLSDVAAELGIDSPAFAGSHVFELLVHEAAWHRPLPDENRFTTLSWKPGRGMRRRHRDGANGLPVETTGPSGRG